MLLRRWSGKLNKLNTRVQDSDRANCQHFRLLAGLLALLTLMLILTSTLARASDGSSEVHFHGTLVVVDCTVNGGNDLTVDFGNAVGIHQIDGSHYEKTVPFDVQCSNENAPAFTLTLAGSVTDYNPAAVISSVNGLGIELKVNGLAQPINQAFSVKNNALPVISAVPVVKPGVTLKAQQFTGNINLIVETP